MNSLSADLTDYQVRLLKSLDEISAQEWDRLNTDAHVLTSHAFLYAFENTNALTENGWQSAHLVIDANDTPIAVMPLYIKDNSMGEFVFDFMWADAYARYGIPYYPKLLTAVPFTPATGPRILHNPNTHSLNTLWPLIAAHIDQLCATHEYSSHHINFCTESLACLIDQTQTPHYWLREDTQYHWRNHDYADFDAFLTALSSKRRKNIRRERRIANASGYDFVVYTGATLPPQQWDNVYQCHERTFWEHWREPPLSQAVFEAWGTSLRDQMLMFCAIDAQFDIIAVAICFADQHRLYGRYWGALVEVECLHFELCYYQGIEYCIKQGLMAFEPGAQGEHKIWRGFDPVTTRSVHYIHHEGMAKAIGDYLDRERGWSSERRDLLSQHSAYRQHNS